MIFRFTFQVGRTLGWEYCLPGLASHIHVALGLGFLPHTVLEGNTPTPASTETECIYQKPLSFDYAQCRGCYVQDERYIAIEHRDVRRDCGSFARHLKMNGLS
jgi:hypothetical protein